MTSMPREVSPAATAAARPGSRVAHVVPNGHRGRIVRNDDRVGKGRADGRGNLEW